MASTSWLFVGVAVVLGLLFGSFLNVCIARLPYHESIVRPASHCPGCMFPIRWYDNVPLLSFVMLRGRCRKCFQRISWRYPLVELAVALWFALAALLSLPETWLEPARVSGNAPGQPILGIGIAALGFLLIGLAMMDWETQIIPDSFTLTGGLIGFCLVCVQAMLLPTGVGDIHLHQQVRMSSPGSMAAKGDVFMTGPEHMVFGRLVAILAAAGILWLFRVGYRAVRGEEGLGRGDIKLLAMIAAFLGFWPAMLALFLGVVGCGFYAAVLLAMRRATARTRLPLGSFLAGGGLVAAVLGPVILRWYVSLL
jgi:leader peptidase (prepilin peptidase)/N-methyltransferase